MVHASQHHISYGAWNGGNSISGRAWQRLAEPSTRQVLKLRLLPGKWLVWGRVFLENDDGDRQKASVELRLMDGPQIDLWVAYLSEERFVNTCVALQGAIDVPGKDDKPIAIEMFCSTYKGSARWARLMAHPVTNFGDFKIP